MATKKSATSQPTMAQLAHLFYQVALDPTRRVALHFTVAAGSDPMVKEAANRFLQRTMERRASGLFIAH